MSTVSCIVAFTSIVSLSTALFAQGPAPLGPEVFKQRRQVLLDSLGEGTAILYAGGEHGEAGFRSSANFYYLTGLDEPDAILVLAPGEYDKDILLLPPRDMDEERWIAAISSCDFTERMFSISLDEFLIDTPGMRADTLP